MAVRFTQYARLMCSVLACPCLLSQTLSHQSSYIWWPKHPTHYYYFFFFDVTGNCFFPTLRVFPSCTTDSCRIKDDTLLNLWCLQASFQFPPLMITLHSWFSNLGDTPKTPRSPWSIARGSGIFCQSEITNQIITLLNWNYCKFIFVWCLFDSLKDFNGFISNVNNTIKSGH